MLRIRVLVVVIALLAMDHAFAADASKDKPATPPPVTAAAEAPKEAPKLKAPEGAKAGEIFEVQADQTLKLVDMNPVYILGVQWSDSLQHWVGGDVIFGLRSDGVVVWRKVGK